MCKSFKVIHFVSFSHLFPFSSLFFSCLLFSASFDVFACVCVCGEGERLIQYASENLVTEILIHPQYNTLIQCMRNMLSSFTKHRHIIHSGYTFSGNGSWILQVNAEAMRRRKMNNLLRSIYFIIDIVQLDFPFNSIHHHLSFGVINLNKK